MDQSNHTTLWDSIPKYQRRNTDSARPPSERIDPDLPGAHFWVILVTNWQNLHPLVQDVLYDWYRALSKTKGDLVEELDPKSTEALVRRLEVLDQKLTSFDLERSNLEQELSIRDRDFQRLRSLTGKREKENIEVQHLLGKTFQEKIMEKQEEIDSKEEYIRDLEERVRFLESNGRTEETPHPEVNQSSKEIQDEISKLTSLINEQNETIEHLRKEVNLRDEKIREIKDLIKL
ncbi:MAG: hypothetical protein ACFFDW_06715 [Candidatus Thorarchaeota archaeon]